MNIHKLRNRLPGAALLLLSAPALAQTPSAQPPGASVAAPAVIDHLEQTIAWYRTVEATATLEGISDEIVLNNSLHQTALRAVESGFDFARADAALIKPSNSAIRWRDFRGWFRSQFNKSVIRISQLKCDSRLFVFPNQQPGMLTSLSIFPLGFG